MLSPAIIFSITLSAGAAAQVEDCPVWLDKGAFVQGNATDGWVGLMPGAARLSGGGLLHGAPSEEAYLKPDEIKEHKQGKRQGFLNRWQLGQPHPFETWMFCAYGGQGSLQLFKKIDPRASECTATTEMDQGALTSVRFVCR